MLSRTVALWIVLLAGCAGAQKTVAVDDLTRSKRTPNLYVGHSQWGTLVVAANHYDAMGGLAVSSSDLGLADRKTGGNDMSCRREIVTGSHVPHWICRYDDDVAQDRAETQDWLNTPRLLVSTQWVGAGVLMGRGFGGGSYRGPAVP
jgi:hypothetical protein